MGRRVAVWMDGEEAEVFHIRTKGFDEATVHAPKHRVRRHPADEPTGTRNHLDDQHRFFHELAGTLKDAEQILLLGPSTTKLLFLLFLQASDPALATRIVGLETADHPTDGQIATQVRRYFWSSRGALTHNARS
jgi:stalled ribosome rescue protein Dom34